MTGTHGTDDLRRVFAAQQDNSPDAVGLLDSVRHGAAKRRRTRRRALAAGAALAATVAVAVPLYARSSGGTPQGPAGGTRTPAASPLTVSASIDEASGYTAIVSGVVGSTQQLVVRPKGSGGGKPGGTVLVYAPGTFDPAPYLGGRKVSVNGYEAYYVPDVEVPLQAAPGPVSGLPTNGVGHIARLTWHLPSGEWAVLSGVFPTPADPLPSMLALAESVRFGPARAIAAPFRLPEVPQGVRPQAARLEGTLVELSFLVDGATLSPQEDLVDAGQQAALLVSVSRRDSYRDAHMPADRAPVRLGEADAWYVDGSERGPIVVPPQGAGLIVRTATCAGYVIVRDASLISRAAMERLVAKIRFQDCGNPATWVAPLQ